MAKLGSFFRRVFTSFTSDDDYPSSLSFPDSRKSAVTSGPFTPPSAFPSSTINSETRVTSNASCRSCSASPRVIIKQTTIHTDNNGNCSSKRLSSSPMKPNNRRLSAPLIIHASTHPRHNRSKLAGESTEEALISPLQRLSLSSTTGTSVHHNISVHSLGASAAGSVSASPRNDVLSSSLNLSLSNSINLSSPLNNISPASGTPPTQFVAGPSSSSPRVSIQSTNSTSPNTDRKMSLQTRGRRPSMFDPIDPKELQQALYASAAAKANLPTNPINDDESTRAFSRLVLTYDRDSGQVVLQTLSLENLQLLDSYANQNNGEFISFYCRFRLLPEKRSLFQTKLVRLTRLQSSYLFDNKQLNEFSLSYEQLNYHSIEILLYKISTIKPLHKDIRLGTVKYDFNELIESEQSRMKKPLDECDPMSIVQDPDLGELLLSLSYLQSAAKLSVVILEAKSLRPLSIETKSFPDAFAKVILYDRHGKKLKRKKTSVQRTSDCPIFNEELVFELRREIASEVMIEVRLVHESLSHKEQLGSIIFGPTINHMIKGPTCPANTYWAAILSGESLHAQWQILKTPIKIEESK